MRLLRLDLGNELGTVDLHPFMSMIHGLSAPQRDALIEAVRALTTGSGDLPFGLVEVDGQLTELRGAEESGIGPFTTEDVVVAVDDVVVGEFDLPGRIAELDQVRKQAQIDAVYVEETRADLVPSALADLQRVKDALDGRSDRPPEVLDLEAKIQAVTGAVGAIRSVAPIVREIPPEVAGLVGRWDAFKESRAEAQPHIDTLNDRLYRAEVSLTESIDSHAEAKALAVPIVLTQAEDTRLTELSTESIDKRKRGRRNSDEESAEAEALLAKVGQDTFAGYVMYRMSPQPSPAHVQAVQLAAGTVEAARAEVEEARAALGVDPVQVALNDEFAGIKDEARGHLGMMLPDDLGAALEGLVEERENPEWVSLARELVDHLLNVGLDGATIESVEPSELPGLADGWLRTAQIDLEELTAESPDRDELIGDVERAESRFQRHARAMSRIDQMEARAASSAETVRDLEALIARAEASDGTGPTEDLGARVRRLADRVRHDAGAAAPLLLDGEFSGLGDDEVMNLLTSLEPMAQEVQLILLSDRSAVNRWAREVGLRRALQSTMVVSSA